MLLLLLIDDYCTIFFGDAAIFSVEDLFLMKLRLKIFFFLLSSSFFFSSKAFW